MELFWTTLQLAIAAGLATTFDDTIYLTAFFAETNRHFRPGHVIVGELIGFSVLAGISLLGCGIGLVIPRTTIGLLGVLPILIGCRYLISQWLAGGEEEPGPSNDRGGQRRAFASTRPRLSMLLADPQTHRVAVVTISNGANNLSIYIPLFASLSLIQNLLVIIILYAFIGLWLLLSFHLTRAPALALLLNRYAPTLLPFLLIWLGFRILSDSGSLALWKAA